jgi:peroxiredoxin
MKSAVVLTTLALVMTCLAPAAPVAAQQAPAIRPVTVGSPMPDFTLPSIQGQQITLSKLKGKNVLLIFLRGRSAPGAWCHICNYQHAELVDYDAKEQFRKKANLEILFVLPYAKQLVQEWVDTYITQLGHIEAWRKPDPAKMDDTAKRRLELTKTGFPKTFSVTPAELPGPFPILMDSDQAVSKGLGLFSLEWGGSKVEQDIPAVFLVDATGKLQFKYVSQNTLDRPPLPYLVRMVGLLTTPR